MDKSEQKAISQAPITIDHQFNFPDIAKELIFDKMSQRMYRAQEC